MSIRNTAKRHFQFQFKTPNIIQCICVCAWLKYNFQRAIGERFSLFFRPLDGIQHMNYHLLKYTTKCHVKFKKNVLEYLRK